MYGHAQGIDRAGQGAEAGALCLQEVSFGYRGRPVLHDLTWAVPPGITALMGPNGAGKTTLLRLCAGELEPRQGRVLRPGGDAAGRAVTLLPQHYELVPAMRVQDTVTHAAWSSGLDDPALGKAVERALGQVDLLDRRRDRVRTLSGGQGQRLAIACALAPGARLLLLDEPSVGLDPVQRRALRDLLRELGRTTDIVLSTHLVDDVVATAEHVAVLLDGRIVHQGPLARLQQGGGSLEQAYVDLVSGERG